MIVNYWHSLKRKRINELKRFLESEWEEVKDDFQDEDNKITRLINTVIRKE